jgi:hypothetical protein
MNRGRTVGRSRRAGQKVHLLSELEEKRKK